jgi:hypothetical protein
VQIYSLGPYSDTLSTVSSTPTVSTTIPASQVPYQAISCNNVWAAPPWTEVTFVPGNRELVFTGRKYAIALEPEQVSVGSTRQPSYFWYHRSSYLGGDGYTRRIDMPGLNFNWDRWGTDFMFKTYVDVPDSDGDGLTNDIDQCDYDPGPASMNGCPISTDSVSPAGSVKINRGARITRSRTVTLSLNATDPAPYSGVESMRIKNAGGSWTSWQPYDTRKGWKLTRGEGKKTAYIQYKDGADNVSAKATDSITYRP